MRRFRNSIFYLAVIGGFTVFMYWIALQGKSLEKGKILSVTGSGSNQWSEFISAIKGNIGHPLAILLAQIVTIIFAARFFGWIFRKIGQPGVIGEIIAGIVLGPSLLGSYFPGFSDLLFPDSSLPNLQFLSQIGLILFMFVIGMELDLKVIQTKMKDAVVISHASIIIPFALGMGLAFILYDSFAASGVSFLAFSLFMGIAMSITAFPVLARIVQERGMHRTRLGTIVLTCAAADDITAWCILAAVIAIVKAGSVISSVYTIISVVLYVLLMIRVVRPFLRRVGDLHSTREKLSKPIVSIFLLTLIISAYATEIIGIHALFGAFMAGAMMPENSKFRTLFIDKIEDVAVVLLLPLFFVFTGLRTQIGLLDDMNLWKITGLIILVAVIGKFAGSTLTAKFVGQNWKDSLTIGALMNTRGLMELVVLNIGYDLGVLTPEIFAMMVIMALVTTFMTGPALNLINRAFKSRAATVVQEIYEISKYKILISFGNPDGAKSLIRMAHGLVRKMNSNSSVTAMHLAPSTELHQYNMEAYENESFEPVLEESRLLNQKIITYFKASGDIDSDIPEVANRGDYDLLLIGFGQSIFEGSLLGKILGFTTRIINPDRFLSQVTGKENLFEYSPFDERTDLILSKSTIPVGILIDKHLKQMNHVFVPVFSEHDGFLLSYAQRLIKNSSSHITVLDVTGNIRNNAGMKELIRLIEQTAPQHINLIQERLIDKEFLHQQDLVLISINSWKKLVSSKSIWLSDIPSALILSEQNKTTVN